MKALLVVAFTCCLLVVGYSIPAHSADYTVTFTDGPVGRTFRLHVPSGCSSYHLIVALHGGGNTENGTGSDIKTYGALESDNDCMIVAYPRSLRIRENGTANPGGDLDYQWNFATELAATLAADQNTPAPDDVAFVKKIRKAITGEIAFTDLYSQTGTYYSPVRSALVGFSGGAALALRMACTNQAAAYDFVWAVSGSMGTSISSCTGALGSGHQRVWIVAGTTDPGVWYLGATYSWSSSALPDGSDPYVYNYLGIGGYTVYGIPTLFDFLKSAMGLGSMTTNWYLYDDSATGVSNTSLLYHWLGAQNENHTYLNLVTMHGHCTGGGYQQGSCSPALGGGHRWPGGVCSPDHCDVTSTGGCGTGGTTVYEYGHYLSNPGACFGGDSGVGHSSLAWGLNGLSANLRYYLVNGAP